MPLIYKPCTPCGEQSLHRSNPPAGLTCIHCGSVYIEPYVVLDPTSAYRRILSVQLGNDELTRRRKAARRGVTITHRGAKNVRTD